MAARIRALLLILAVLSTWTNDLGLAIAGLLAPAEQNHGSLTVDPLKMFLAPPLASRS
jgi:hypothetical protein